MLPQEPLEDLEIAPFRLRYDAALLDSLIARGRVDAEHYGAVAAGYREVAELLVCLICERVHSLLVVGGNVANNSINACAGEWRCSFDVDG